jgi:hypothetical protein
MKKKLLLVAVLFYAALGAVQAQISFTLWNRAQIVPLEVTTTEGNKPHLESELWWTRFMVGGHNAANTMGFDAEVDFRYTSTGNQYTIFTYNDGISSFADKWTQYYMWIKPVDWTTIWVGKYDKRGGDGLNLPFFDFLRYTHSIDVDVFTGYGNGSYGGPDGGMPLGFLWEMYFGDFTIDLNFKSIDPTMPIGDYLRTIQAGLSWDAPGIGIFRAQMIGFDFNDEIPVKGNFDPDGDGLAAGVNYYRPDNAGSQMQIAANLTMFPGMKLALGVHYYFTQSEIDYDNDDVTWGTTFVADTGAISFPLYYTLSLFNPWTFYLKGNVLLGRDRVFGQWMTYALAGAEADYKFNDMFTARASVSAVNLGTEVYGAKLRQRQAAVDIGLGLHIIYRYCQLQAGVVLRYDAHSGTQLGWAIPITFDFTLFNWN